MPATPAGGAPPSPVKPISGLPNYSSSHYRDVHMDTAKGMTAMKGYADVRMATAKGYGDIHMETARGDPTVKKTGFQVWEKELLESGEVKRKATVAQLCMWFMGASRSVLIPYRLPRLLLPDAGIHCRAQGSQDQV
jgi:hypothetical protein